jgi:F420-non-reducing hydrogenase large subunit
MTEHRTVRIDPLTRLEGHGRVEMILDDRGELEHAWFQVPELRGFEKFCEGRPAEDMPQITSRICGVCPTAHHMASAKALDSLYSVEPPPAGRRIRELIYNAFFVEDHALHFYMLGGPDFIVGPRAPAAERNVLGVIGKLGKEAGLKVIEMRRKLREIISTAGGKAVHPVFGLPGGVARAIKPEEQARFIDVAREAVAFGLFSIEAFGDIVLNNRESLELIRSRTFTHRTHSMGLVDEQNRVNFYDGQLRVVSPAGGELAKFPINRYEEFIGERTEPWSYMKFTYFKPAGWHGFSEGDASGVYTVAPLARLNASEGFTTPLAQKAREAYFAALGPGPVHHTLANHWARLIEMLHAAERLREIAEHPELCDPDVRTIPTQTPSEGFGVVEAPRGVLIHHYATDERGLIRRANLIVATQHNAARLAMSVQEAARAFVKDGEIDDGMLNMVELAVRAYDPCLGCATHALPGSPTIRIDIRNRAGDLVASLPESSPQADRR